MNGSVNTPVAPMAPEMLMRIFGRKPENPLAQAYRDLNARLIAETRAHHATKDRLAQVSGDIHHLAETVARIASRQPSPNTSENEQ